MNNIIHIPEPCHEKWSNMKDAGNKQRHCDSCKTNVHDLSRSPLSEINATINAANGEKLCGHYHERHTTTSKKVYLVANFIEDKLMKLNFKRASIFIVALVLIFSGCARKHLKGRYSVQKKQNPNKQTVREI